MKMMNLGTVVKQIAVGLAVSAAFLAGSMQAATLTWNLAGGGNWNDSTANWTENGGATTRAFPSDNTADVIFNKAGGTIDVSAGMQPASTTVSAASGTYTFNTGAIAGSGGLTKSGGGTLTLSNPNSTYTGKTIIQGGTLLTAGAAYLSNAGVAGVFGAPAAGANATIDLHNGVILQNKGSNPRVNQSTNRNLNLAGTGSGTVSIKYNDNDASLTFGAVTATGTGPKTLALFTGTEGNGDREAMIFTGGIANSSDSSPTSLAVTFNTQGSSNWVSISGVNTFTGPITLTQINGTANGVLVIGGVRTAGFGSVNTVGTGSLGSGNYPGAISLGTRTVLEYDSTAAQTLAGVISGPGTLQVTGSGTLTLSGVNTYTGNTTVNSGSTVVLGSTGGLKFVVTDAATNNKVTGAGTATMNGTFTIDTTAVTLTSGSWTLVNATTKSFAASFSVNGFNDADLDNVWTKLDGGRKWSFSEATGVLTLGTVAEFLTFGLPGNPGIIDNTAKTIQLFVPVGTNLATLAPVFTVSSGTCNQTSDSPPSTTFAVQNPANYTITDTAPDPDIVNTYSVSVQTYGTWAHTGSFFILTTPDGANIPVGASEANFPLLVRLNAGNFNFGEAQPDGSDIRFITAAGSNLSYQIEQWDAVNGQAAVWVKIPTITGNSRQEIKMYWGKTGVASQSNGANVFNSANGYASVFHMNEPLVDVAGSVTSPTDTGTTQTTGMIGKGRNFTAGKGIACGTTLTGLPQGVTTHSTQCWFRTSAVNCDMVDWGQEGGGFNKVQIRVVSPPRIYIDGNGASVTGNIALAPAQWHQVVHTYGGNSTKIYVDGQFDKSATVTMNLPNPTMMWIGGWYNNYAFVGDMDEVRISNVTRSANWIKMEYENQKPMQTMVGNLVQAGDTFTATPPSLTLNEGSSASLSGEAGGAQKVYWIETKNGVDTILATDQLTLGVTAGRVTGDQSYVIQFKGIYPSGNRTVDIPVTISEYLPDPVFTLTGPSTWDGRQTITVTPDISNLASLQAKGVANLTYSWNVAGVAVSKTITAGTPTVPGVLTLTRSQGSGPMTVTLVLNNGGALVTATKTIIVQEPASDAWVERTPGASEKALNNQFYARNPGTNKGTIFYNGTQVGSPDTVYLKIYTTDSGEVLYDTHRQTLGVGGTYAFSAPIDAGKVTYKVVYGTTTAGTDTPVATVTNLVCGDAYIIDGQSNALATDNTAPNDSTTDAWVRTYGLSLGWGYGISKGTEMQLGVWGMILAKRMAVDFSMPVCFIQGAVGGTRIDQHQANPTDHTVAGSSYAIYANILNRVAGAKLTHGIRGVFWHQGENNSGAAAPTGDWDYKSYQQYFVDMAAAWKQDYPNLQRYIIYQVMPKPCAMGPKGDQLRDVQRSLPRLFSNMNILCTLALPGYEGCHFSPTGYLNFANFTAPLVGQDFYGITPAMSVTAPILLRAYYSSIARTEITLEFDQDMSWSSFSKPNYYLDKVGSKVASGNEDPVNKKLIKLQLSSAGTATSTLDYLQDASWSYSEPVSSLLYGVNAIPALTFADVIIAPPGPTELTATPGDAQVALSWSASGGATGYNVKRSTSNGGPYTLIGNSVSTGYTDLGVINGTTYYYVVSATVSAGGSTGESPDSSQATALPLSSAKDILTFEFPGLPATTITGTDISVSVPFGTPVTALVPNITISPLAALAPLSGVANNFTSPQTYTVTAQNLSTKNYTVTVTVGTSAPFTAWAHDPAQGLTAGINDGLMDDPDHDGIPNLLEFALGGHPMTAARSILPVLTKSGGVWYFEYERSDASQSSTTQAVEYGNNLTGWTALAIPATTGGAVTITPGSPSDHVKVSIPDPGANGFVRLRVTTP